MFVKFLICSITCLLMFTCTVHAQLNQINYEYSSSSLYLRKLPNAGMEAMGKNFMTGSGSNSAAHLNPASIAMCSGYSLEYTGLNHDNSALLNDNDFIGIAAPITSLFTVGMSYYSVRYTSILTDVHVKYHVRFYSLRAAYKLFSHYLIGFNVNFLSDRFLIYKFTSIYPDIGILYAQSLNENKWLDSFHAGFSVTNVTKSKLKVKKNDITLDEKAPFPAIAHAGIAFRGSYRETTGQLGLKMISWTCAAEYQDDLVSEIYSGFRLGAETSLYEILNLRCGYYRIKRYKVELEEVKKYLSDFTYGLGIYLPVSRILNNGFPIDFSFDYIAKGQPTTTKEEDIILLRGDDRFNVYQITAVWKR